MPPSENLSRRKFFRMFLLVAALVVIGGIILLYLYRRGRSSVEVSSWRIVGNELRLLLDTYRMRGHGNYAGSSDRMGYYVTIELDASGPLPERTRIYGPVSGPTEQSRFTHLDDCLNYLAYSDQSVGPVCAFDQEGSLVRFTRDITSQVITREVLVIEVAGAHWKRQGESKPMEKYLYENNKSDSHYVATPSGRYVAMFAGGVPTVFDRLTGETKPDPWLESALTQVLIDNGDKSVSSRADRTEPTQTQANTYSNLDYLTLFLSEDLAHLVAWVRPKSADTVVYTRDEKAPLVIKNSFGKPFPIDGRLYFFVAELLKLQLSSADDTEEFHIDNTDRKLWPDELYFYSQHRLERSAVTMCAENHYDPEAGIEPGDRFTVVTWFYRKNKVSTEEIFLIDLFRRWDGQLYPKAVLPVK